METKKITIQNEAVVSVGGAYYTEYTVDDKDYSVGELTSCKIKEVRGMQSREYNSTLEITKSFLEAIQNKKLEAIQNKKLEAIRKCPKLYLLQLYVYYCNSTRAEHSLYSSVCEVIENGSAYDVWDENGELDIDKEREVIYSMTEEEFKDNSQYSYLEYFESFFDNLSEEIEEMDEDDEERKELEKVIDEMPSPFLILNEEELAEYRKENGDIFIDGFEYIIRDTF